MKYIIDRTRWLRGEGGMVSRLLRYKDGKMCCLGQIATQCGIPTHLIESACTPSESTQLRLSPWPAWMLDPELGRSETTDCRKAMDVNDDKETTDAVKEDALAAIFAKHGDELEFIN